MLDFFLKPILIFFIKFTYNNSNFIYLYSHSILNL